eukprot:SAG31_NODE_22_length_33849_cov_13.713096_9_plen_816_part_00
MPRLPHFEQLLLAWSAVSATAMVVDSVVTATPPSSAVGMSLGLAPPSSRSKAAVFAPLNASLQPQHLQLAGTRLCIGWTKSTCDGFCLETVPCAVSTPKWVVERSILHNESDITHLKSTTGACKAGCCMDFEDKTAVLQAFPVCTEPFGNQGFQLVPALGKSGAVSMRALFQNRGWISVLGSGAGCPITRKLCYAGADLLPKGKVDMTLPSCCDLCHRTVGCVGVVLNPSGANATCYLKSKLQDPSPGECISGSLGSPFPAPPPPIVHPINETLSRMWRPTFHPTGFGSLADEGVGHLQDPSAPFQDSAGIWHVFPDCTPETWNAGVSSPYTLVAAKKQPYLGWCHLSSTDLVRWKHNGPAVWFDNTTAMRNGSGFSGNCGTGGGSVNAAGEFIAFCPHDGTGIYVFAANSSSVDRLKLSPRPSFGQNCTSAGFHGCAMVPPSGATVQKVQPSDPGTPFTASDGRIYQVWGNRGDASVFLYKAPAGDSSLRHFGYDKVLFNAGYVPPQFCHAYGPFTNSSCNTAYRATAIECPDFMLIQKQPLLIGSLGLGAIHSLPVTSWWSASSWTPGMTLKPTTSGMLDYGSFYAPKTAASADGRRRIMFGWVTERWCDVGDEYNGGCTSNAPHTLPPVGWDGSQSLPRELSFDSQGQLLIQPVRESVLLRSKAGTTHVQNIQINAGDVPHVITAGRALEVRLNLSMPEVGALVAMDVLASVMTTERTMICLNGSSKQLEIITAHSSLGPVGGREPYTTPPLAATAIELAVWVDHSVVEVFVNSRIVVTARVYPTVGDSTGVRLWSLGSNANVSIASWHINS